MDNLAALPKNRKPQSPPRVISGPRARGLLAALAIWEAAVVRIEGHVPTAEQHRLLTERVRPVFKAMAVVGLRDPFALGPRWAPVWQRFFELVGNRHYGDAPSPARTT